MNTQDVINIFKQADAILEGHFILTSGRHSATYLQKAKVFMHADLTEKLCYALAQKIKKYVKEKIDYVVGPAIGGLIPSYETSRHLCVPSIWVERVNGIFQLRRFEIEKDARVVIVEDIMTTGLSIRETIEALVEAKANVVASACILDRSGGKVNVGVPLISLAEYEIASYDANALPPELAVLPAIKPGSRNI
ncbi:orotate phosphoribosyltransferase [Bartonella sp. CDC_skunk]|uniref:orotate phosphoribosyltransferase n=1 Tax=Bartonella TaxID=773 RepID=UPI0009998F50|nr:MULTISPECIES: orotate phosphoribosyltransferase [unclassified Bartonella]AQX18571.1 orotate phosphoribosyltransferase [Bartonella sp. A1379B]AQX21575.1 orotate phosphoribosyltransferase [Bartonella sp. CDC_skunk]AQX26838.1 orotate phosphoribosyltransferase [Bartonella sp. Raccoon60]